MAESAINLRESEKANRGFPTLLALCSCFVASFSAREFHHQIKD